MIVNSSVVERDLDVLRAQIQEASNEDGDVGVMNGVFRDIDEDQDALISEEEVIDKLRLFIVFIEWVAERIYEEIRCPGLFE